MCVAGAGTLPDEETAMMNVVTWGVASECGFLLLHADAETSTALPSAS